jgi:sec-independent protein translocase protein TatA
LECPAKCRNFVENSELMNMILVLGLGTPEIILILLVVLLLFGGKKIPELMRGLGRGIREFNDAKGKVQNEIKKGMDETPKEEKNETSKEEKHETSKEEKN